jgi:hypothetical protein
VASYLQAAGRLFSQSPQMEQRRFVREVFERIAVSGETGRGDRAPHQVNGPVRRWPKTTI